MVQTIPFMFSVDIPEISDEAMQSKTVTFNFTDICSFRSSTHTISKRIVSCRVAHLKLESTVNVTSSLCSLARNKLITPQHNLFLFATTHPTLPTRTYMTLQGGVTHRSRGVGVPRHPTLSIHECRLRELKIIGPTSVCHFCMLAEPNEVLCLIT